MQLSEPYWFPDPDHFIKSIQISRVSRNFTIELESHSQITVSDSFQNHDWKAESISQKAEEIREMNNLMPTGLYA